MGASQDLENIEKHLRNGAIDDAQRLIKKLSVKNYIINDKARAASLAKRAILPQYGIKWLFSSVYPDGRLNRDCLSTALLEYASNLVFAGAVREGRRILQGLTQKNEPQADLYLAFSYMKEWDYLNASKHLKLYLKNYSGSPYGKVVAQVNLLASYVRTQPHNEETIELSKELLKNAQGKDFRRLYLNVLELSVQLHVVRKEFTEATKHLSELASASPSENSLEYLFWMKWKLILEFSESQEKDLASLKKLVDLAEKFQHGETLRDAHLRWALANKNLLLFEHVYHGTPHASFKEQAEKDFHDRFKYEFSISEKHFFVADRAGFSPLLNDNESSSSLNLLSGFFKTSQDDLWKPELKTQQLPFKLLQVICNDFYQSKNNVELSSHIYSGSHFHPLHSIQGVQQLVKRLNDQLRFLADKTACEAQVHYKNNRYELRSNAFCFVKSRTQPTALHKDEWQLLDYFSKEADRRYSRKELENLTQTPPRTLSRYLEKLVKEKELLLLGKGPNTRYLKNPEKT